MSGDHNMHCSGNQPDIVTRLRADAEYTDDIGLCADAADEIERLRRIEAAQLAELEAISAALGTNEGHSSVHHIERLRAEVERLQNELAHWMNHWRTKL